jgi:hypothetical protein
MASVLISSVSPIRVTVYKLCCRRCCHYCRRRQKQKPNLFRIIIGEEKVRGYLRFLKRDHRRATLHLESSSRADLGEALKLFRRVLDELD